MFHPTGYDFGFRPASYWDFEDPLKAILANVKGSRRREMIRDVIASDGARREQMEGLLGNLDPAVFAESIDSSFTSTLTAIAGPSWLGGEFLPARRVGEVEIARLTLASVTQDVISVRARQGARRIYYRIVDEYGSVWELKRKSSNRPITMYQLIQLINTATMSDEIEWDDLVTALYDNASGSREERAAFVTVSSEIYPDLESYYADRGRAWASMQVR